MKFSPALVAAVVAVVGPTLVSAQYDDAVEYLGTDPNGCTWKTALICAGSLVSCAGACGTAAAMGELNPFLDVACAGCVGSTAGICAQCWGTAISGQPEVCFAAQRYPGAPQPGECVGATA